MATPSTDSLWSFLDDDALTIPDVKSTKHPEGRSYTIPSPDAITGAKLNALSEIATKVHKGMQVTAEDVARLNLNDDEHRAFAQQVLGSAHDEMVEDGVSWVRMQRIVQYAYTYFAVSPQAAQEAAERGVFSGKGQARPNRAQRRAPQSGKGRKGRTDSTATS